MNPQLVNALRLQTAQHPPARRGFGKTATRAANQPSSVIDGNQVEATSRHHLPCKRDVGAHKRIVPRFGTNPPLPGLEDEVRHAAHHMIQEMIARDHEDGRLVRFDDVSRAERARRIPMWSAWIDVSKLLEIMSSKQCMRSLIHRSGLDGIIKSICITGKEWGPVSFLDEHVRIGLPQCGEPSTEVGTLTSTITNGEPLRHHHGKAPQDAFIESIVAQNETHHIVKGVDTSVGS